MIDGKTHVQAAPVFDMIKNNRELALAQANLTREITAIDPVYGSKSGHVRAYSINLIAFIQQLHREIACGKVES